MKHERVMLCRKLAETCTASLGWVEEKVRFAILRRRSTAGRGRKGQMLRLALPYSVIVVISFQLQGQSHCGIEYHIATLFAAHSSSCPCAAASIQSALSDGTPLKGTEHFPRSSQSDSTYLLPRVLNPGPFNCDFEAYRDLALQS